MRRLDTLIRHWLDAEARDDARGAERALWQLFQALPRATLPPAFADRVMAALPQPAVGWRLERVAAVLLALSAAAVWAMPLWVGAAWARLLAVDWLGLAGALAATGVRWISAAAELWEVMAEVGRVATVVATEPAVIALLSLCSLLAATGSRLLYELLDERSSAHVDAR